MTSIILTVTGAKALASVSGPLTSGMVGIPVTIRYDGVWDGLTKNMVCRCGQWGPDRGETRTVLSVGESATVAHEVMKADMHLYLGIEGYSADGELVIPTTWADCGMICHGANADADPSAIPKLSVWTQLQAEIEHIRQNPVAVEHIEAAVAAYLEENPIDGSDSSQNTDLTGYATEQYVQEYAQSKGDYPLRSEIPTVPTKVSAFANDAGYLTKHQDISGKADKTGLTLGIHTDGLMYLFVDGLPIGAGIELPTGGGDVYGYVDSENNILLTGALADGSYSIKYEIEDGSTVNIGDLVLDTNVYYSVTNALTHCANSNDAAQAVKGGGYSATISADSGYALSSVAVTMGGTDITATAVSGGNISIANVTGNIVITAVAEEAVVTPTYTNLFDPSQAKLNQRINGSKVLTTDDNSTGKITTNFMDVSDKTPFSSTTKIYIKGATFTADGNTKLLTYKTASGEDYTQSYTAQNGSALPVVDEGNGVVSVSNLTNSFATDVKRMVLTLKVKDTTITTDDIQNIVITVDEPIA